MSNIHTQQTGHVHSPRLISSATPTRSPVAASLAGEPERRPSGSHGHLRQTSKAHPQARNAIFVTSPATSPAGSDLVSPVNDVAGMPDYNTLVRRGQSQRQPSNSPSGTLHGSSHAASTSTTTSERDQSDTGNGTSTHKRLDRAQSSRTRREHSHQRSLSRNQQQEQKTVGEYALHHLFNKVSDSSLKENLCRMNDLITHSRPLSGRLLSVHRQKDNAAYSLFHPRTQPPPLQLLCNRISNLAYQPCPSTLPYLFPLFASLSIPFPPPCMC